MPHYIAFKRSPYRCFNYISIFFLEVLPRKSASLVKKPVAKNTKSSDDVKVVNEKTSPKRKNRKRRRGRFRRVSTLAAKEYPSQKRQDNEEANDSIEGEIGETAVTNGHDYDVVIVDGKEGESKELDVQSVRTLKYGVKTFQVYIF